MPIEDGPGQPHVEVGPSGVVELVWTLGALSWAAVEGKAHRLAVTGAPAAHPELAAEVAGFWADDGTSCADGLELIVLAHRAGVLIGGEVGAPLVALLLAAAAEPPPADIGLLSETEEDRATAHARLVRLAAEPALRARLGDLLVRAWDAVAAEPWSATGARRVADAVAAWPERLRAADSLLDALPKSHPLRRPRYADALPAAGAAGDRVVLAPTFIGGDFHAYFQVPGVILAVVGVGPTPARRDRRADAEGIAARLKALADPTRVLLLAELAERPLSVSELAEALDVAQPTASVHLQKLRDAGLVQARREGGRTVNRVDAADLDRVLDEVRRALHALAAGEPTRS